MGGGKVAYRKAKKLLDYGAKVEVVSPEVITPLNDLLRSDQITIDNYDKKYCRNKYIVVAATDDSELNFKIYKDAKEEGALLNVIDQIELCDFIIPAVYKDGDLQVAISTGGKSPSLARKIRQMLQNELALEYENKLNLLGSIRKLIKTEVDNEDTRREIFTKLAELVQKGDN